MPRDSERTVNSNRVCATVLDAVQAVSGGRADRAAVLAKLDSLLSSGPVWSNIGYSFGVGSWGLLNLAAARLHEAQGDFPGALAAVRRRAYDWSSPVYLSSFLREEGRLAALTGDHVGAILAYQHYLALRSDPEPALRPEVEAVRAELAHLMGERTSPWFAT